MPDIGRCYDFDFDISTINTDHQNIIMLPERVDTLSSGYPMYGIAELLMATMFLGIVCLFVAPACARIVERRRQWFERILF